MRGKTRPASTLSSASNNSRLSLTHEYEAIIKNASPRLSEETLNKLKILLGDKCFARAAFPAEVFHVDSGVWTSLAEGVVCIVKDVNRKMHFIRVFDLNKRATVLEQVVYTSKENYKYRKALPCFHTFEMLGDLVAIQFVDTAEAELFNFLLQEKDKEAMMRQGPVNEVDFRLSEMPALSENLYHSVMGSSSPLLSLSKETKEKRNFPIQEILETEKKYLNELQMVTFRKYKVMFRSTAVFGNQSPDIGRLKLIGLYSINWMNSYMFTKTCFGM